MESPQLPSDEAVRLATLESLNILDTVPEDRFDRLTRMARRLFDVPIALVSLVDANRQWFKSCDGLEVRETARDISFCGHAILGTEVFVIPDASQDPRFADNPLVEGPPYIKFYAGCPLVAYNGSHLGTLCVIDHCPRDFSGEDKTVLADLAAMGERELSALHLATIDELTNVANRRGFMQMANHSLHLNVRQKTPASLVVYDLDNFKQINDSHGHSVGDMALKDFVEAARGSLRNSDLFARVGGDEFVALLNNTRVENAEQVCIRTRESLVELSSQAGRPFQIDFSFGVVGYDPECHGSVEELIRAGDALMYQQKRQRQHAPRNGGI